MAKIPVETVLTARDVNTKALWEGLSQAAGHYHAVVDRVSGAINSLQSVATGGIVLGMGAGFVETTKKVIELNKELESTTNTLAGSIQVYKFAANYNDALLMSEATLKRIKKDAADLPGTDTDFIRAFSISFPEQAQRGVKSLDEAINRSNRLTAVLLTKGVDSGQIGRDLGLIMSGRAGADVRSFMELKGQLGVKDAAAWNALSDKQRFEKLDEVIKKNKDGIDAYANTWEAISSTSESYIKNIVLAGSKPLFEVAKNNLKAINDNLTAAMPKIEKVALLATLTAGHLIAQAGTPEGYAMAAAAQPGTGIAGYEGGMTWMKSLASAGTTLVTLFGDFADMLSAALSFSLGPIFGILPGLGAALDLAVYGFANTMSFVFRGIKLIFDLLGPALTRLMQFTSTAITVAIDVFIIGFAKAKAGVDQVVEAFKWVGKQLHDAFEWIARKLHFGTDSYGPEAPGLLDAISDLAQDARRQLGIGSIGGSVGDFLKRQQEEEARAEAHRKQQEYTANYRAALLKRPSVTQDFRGSRFTIEQKFAQGFDPGRVLTAVREDAQKLAQKRLTAGITPLFGHT